MDEKRIVLIYNQSTFEQYEPSSMTFKKEGLRGDELVRVLKMSIQLLTEELEKAVRECCL